MSAVNEVHVERETLAVEVNIPGHEARTTTALFRHSREALIEREGGRCFISGATAEESGHPLEAHHYPIERSMANMIDWERFAADCKKGQWGPHAQAFDWDAFFVDAEITNWHGRRIVKVRDPYLFVDDMRVNGMLLSKKFHTEKNAGIHDMPFPLWVAQRYGVEGYKFSSTTTIHHFEGEGH